VDEVVPIGRGVAAGDRHSDLHAAPLLLLGPVRSCPRGAPRRRPLPHAWRQVPTDWSEAPAFDLPSRSANGDFITQVCSAEPHCW
jgi:hypothetical protein